MRILIVALILLAALVEVRSWEDYSPGYGSLSTAEDLASQALRAGDVVAVLQDAQGGCAIVERILADFPTLVLNRLEGEVQDYRTGEKGQGCRVEMKGSAAAFRESGPPDVALREQFAGLGWAEDYEYAADGPDGSAFAFRNGPVLCVFRAHWDGGDDSDPSYVPEDRYDIEVDCLLSG